MDNDIELMKYKLDNIKNQNTNELHEFMKEIYEKKKKYIEKNIEYELLDHMENVVKYYLQRIETGKTHLLTLVNLIFLPLGFIVGFFGMNFKSMGTPSLSKGIFTVKHSEKLVFLLSFLSAISIIMFYYNSIFL